MLHLRRTWRKTRRGKVGKGGKKQEKWRKKGTLYHGPGAAASLTLDSAGEASAIKREVDSPKTDSGAVLQAPPKNTLFLSECLNIFIVGIVKESTNLPIKC